MWLQDDGISMSGNEARVFPTEQAIESETWLSEDPDLLVTSNCMRNEA